MRCIQGAMSFSPTGKNHQLHGGHSVVNGNKVVMKFCKEGA
jgi:hypothetical protein